MQTNLILPFKSALYSSTLVMKCFEPKFLLLASLVL